MKTKRIVLLSVISIFMINFLMVAIYYFGYVTYKISDEMRVDQESLIAELNILVSELEATDNLDQTITDFTNAHHINAYYIPLSIHKQKANEQDNQYSYYLSDVFTNQGPLYLVRIEGTSDYRNLSSLKSFVTALLVIIPTIAIIMFLTTDSWIIAPIEKLHSAIKNYKFGIKPEKTTDRTEVGIIQNNFVDLVDSLEAEKEKQNRIIASISHDIKTPLTAILGYSDRVVNMQLPKERRIDYLVKIHNKALAMKELTDEFDDYLSCNIKNTLKQDDIRVIDFLNNIRENYEEDLKEKNIKLFIESQADEELITADIAKLERVISNIITNSVRFIDNFGKINIEVRKTGQYIEFKITDTGPGVPEADLKRIFEPLYTSDPSRKISGLGLSICKQIVESHSGYIYAENSKEGGLSVIFSIKQD